MIQKLTKERVKQAGQVIANAFHNDPLFKVLIPVDKKRKEVLPKLNSFLLELGSKVGNVYITSKNVEGAAIWFSDKTADFGLFQIICAVMLLPGMRLLFKHGKEMLRMQKELAILIKNRKTLMGSRNYLYLSMIAIAPEQQHKGYGSILLKKLFNESKQNNVPIYLETETEENVEIYKHYNFKIINEIDLVDNKVHMWQMLREPE